MNILVDIGHPAHVHFFRNFILNMKKNNHNVCVVARNKDVTFKLLKAYNIPYVDFGTHYKTIIGKLFGGMWFIVKMAIMCIQKKIDIVVDSGGTVYPAVATSLIGIPNISFNNTDVFKVLYISKFFTSAFITPSMYKMNLGKNHIRISSFNELTFLSPTYFKPNKNILSKLDLKSGEKYILLRFVSWNAAEEIGNIGYSIQEIKNIVKIFSKYCKIFISCEFNLPKELSYMQIEKMEKIKFGDMQDVEFFATLFYGESGAMAAECAMLGTPAIFVSSKKLGFLEELEHKYKLVNNFTLKEDATEKAIELLQNFNLYIEYQKRKEKMLSENINYTKFIIWFIENYPASLSKMKLNSEYQYNFK